MGNTKLQNIGQTEAEASFKRRAAAVPYACEFRTAVARCQSDGYRNVIQTRDSKKVEFMGLRSVYFQSISF